MVQLHKTASKVMDFFESFKGSRPALNVDKLLVVRSQSRQNFPLDEMESKLDEVGKIIGGKEVDPISNEAKDILNEMDEILRNSMEISGSVDANGFMRMKNDLETMGLQTEFKIFALKHSNAVIAIWKDRSGIGPLYVEVTICDNGK
ncbi:DUF2120 family protein [Methanobrevibacter sp. DSM 116169]|uniref:DUF2120 family protein n=1 Tax=Methanobrevibacter sp. DSM 116169 TaxID=3242727 RepID=UPI0038FC39A2